MKNRKKVICRIPALLMAAVLSCGACMGASAAEGSTAPDLNRTGSIILTLIDDNGEAMMDGSLSLYQIATVGYDENWNMVYTYTDGFVGFGEGLTQEILDSSAALLAAELTDWEEQHGVAAVRESGISGGSVIFSDLSMGLYLVVQSEKADGFYLLDPFLVSLPRLDNGEWIYTVDAAPKTEVKPEETEPETPEPEMPEPETPEPETPEPGEPNSVPPTSTTPGSTTPSGGSTTGTLPQTGQLNWPIPFLACGGLLLMIIGGALVMSGRRNKNHAAEKR